MTNEFQAPKFDGKKTPKKLLYAICQRLFIFKKETCHRSEILFPFVYSNKVHQDYRREKDFGEYFCEFKFWAVL